MKARYLNIIISLIGLMTFSSACFNEDQLTDDGNLRQDGYKTVRFNVEVPGMDIVQTKAVDPDGGGVQQISLFCFDENSLFITVTTASVKTDGQSISLKGTFEASVPEHTETLQLVGNQNLTYFKEDNFRGMSEVDVMHDLEASAGRMIYWSRKTLTELNSHNSSSNPVKMIRNQAKFTLNVASGVNFVQKGWIVVNTNAFGTVAPYCPEHGFEAPHYQDRPFITLPDNDAKLGDFLDVRTVPEEYVFETENSADAPVDFIVKGSQNGGPDLYYRISIVDAKGEYIPIYRNHHYTVNITGNLYYGQPTFAEALEAPATNNVFVSVSDEIRQITDGRQCYSTTGSFSYSWSPDGKWIVMSYCARGHYPYDDIGIVSTEGGQPMINLTESGYTDSVPQWVLGGNAILFASERYGMRNHASWGTLNDVMIVFLNRKAYEDFMMTKEQKELVKEIEKLSAPEEDKKKDDKKSDKKEDKKEKVEDIVVELEDIDNRIKRLTPSSSNLGYATLSKDGTELYYQAAYESGMTLWKLDLKEGTPNKIGSASGRMVWDEKFSNLYVLGGRFSKMKEGGKSLESISVRAEMVMDLAAEREYMFNHVYRQEKERFYNEKMHGVDWEMLTAAYRKFLPHINNNYDFAELLSEYLGELNVSHTGSGYRAPASRESASTANLGVFFDLGWQEDGLKVAEIVKGGPFDKASSKLEAGDVITSINGVEIRKGMDFYPLLNRKAGERTLIGIRKASGEKAEMVVLPVSESKFADLLYKRWVRQNAEKVQQLSGGRLGYVHIEGMDDASFRTVYSDILGRYNNCDGIVIDTRFNGGGRLHEDIEVLFSGEKYLTQEIRGKDACDMPSRRYNKASIMIIGEANYSNAHGTPWVYKYKDMGLLVGKPVPGTMTSVTWETLQDPTLYFGIPVVGYRKADGTYLENDQLNPDIDVENTKELVVTGRDEQLEAAVKALLKQIDNK